MGSPSGSVASEGRSIGTLLPVVKVSAWFWSWGGRLLGAMMISESTARRTWGSRGLKSGSKIPWGRTSDTSFWANPPVASGLTWAETRKVILSLALNWRISTFSRVLVPEPGCTILESLMTLPLLSKACQLRRVRFEAGVSVISSGKGGFMAWSPPVWDTVISYSTTLPGMTWVTPLDLVRSKSTIGVATGRVPRSPMVTTVVGSLGSVRVSTRRST